MSLGKNKNLSKSESGDKLTANISKDTSEKLNFYKKSKTFTQKISTFLRNIGLLFVVLFLIVTGLLIYGALNPNSSFSQSILNNNFVKNILNTNTDDIGANQEEKTKDQTLQKIIDFEDSSKVTVLDRLPNLKKQAVDNYFYLKNEENYFELINISEKGFFIGNISILGQECKFNDTFNAFNSIGEKFEIEFIGQDPFLGLAYFKSKMIKNLIFGI